MAEILELPQLVELNRVPQMKVRPRRVESFLDAQRLAALELRGKLCFDNQFVRAALEYGELMSDVKIHGMMLLLQLRTARSCNRIDRSELYWTNWRF